MVLRFIMTLYDERCKLLIIGQSQWCISRKFRVLYTIFPTGYVTSYHQNQFFIFKANLIQVLIPLYNHFSSFFSPSQVDWSESSAEKGSRLTPVHLGAIFSMYMLKIVPFRQASTLYKRWSIQRNIIRYLVVLSFGSSSRLFFLWVLLIDWSLLVFCCLVLSYLVLVLSCLISCFALSFLVLFCSG